MYVLDSNTVIYLFKGLGRVPVSFLRTPPRDIAIPSVVVYELETGVAKSQSPETSRVPLDELLSRATVLPFGLAEARASARIRASLESRGTPIGPLDTLIAGTALSHGATLVTHNAREFGRIEGLSIVDWY
jgi:tRNA(fMet)-specific endonuclease VapC